MTRVPRRAGQPVFEKCAVSDLLGDENLPRNVAARGIELLQGRSEHGVGLREVIEKVTLPGDHLPVPHRKDLNRCTLAFHVDSEQIPLLQLRGGDLLWGLQALESTELVTQGRRCLETLAPRGFVHGALQPLDHLAGAPLDEEPRILA